MSVSPIDRRWLSYWRDSAISQTYFIDCIRGVIGLDALSITAGKKRGGSRRRKVAR
jgi:hypothetical protein